MTDGTRHTPVTRRIVVAISGASGAVYGVRLMQMLREAAKVEIHLVASSTGYLIAQQELDMTADDLHALADVVHPVANVGAAIASGSFRADGMVVAPCSMRTLGSIAHAMSDNLISRAADVMLKERRRLILMVRETPLHLAHLRNMTAATEMGAIIFPPVPAFYLRPESVDDLVNHSVSRVIDLLGLEQPTATRWDGLAATQLQPVSAHKT